MSYYHLRVYFSEHYLFKSVFLLIVPLLIVHCLQLKTHIIRLQLAADGSCVIFVWHPKLNRLILPLRLCNKLIRAWVILTIKNTLCDEIYQMSEFNNWSWNWILLQLTISCECYSEFEQSPCYQVIILFYIIYRLFNLAWYKIYNNNHKTVLYLSM